MTFCRFQIAEDAEDVAGIRDFFFLFLFSPNCGSGVSLDILQMNVRSVRTSEKKPTCYGKIALRRKKVLITRVVEEMF